MYYIAYAAFSELRGNFTRAESIYQQGLERWETSRLPAFWNSAEHGLELLCTVEASMLASRRAQINLLVR